MNQLTQSQPRQKVHRPELTATPLLPHCCCDSSRFITGVLTDRDCQNRHLDSGPPGFLTPHRWCRQIRIGAHRAGQLLPSAVW